MCVIYASLVSNWCLRKFVEVHLADDKRLHVWFLDSEEMLEKHTLWSQILTELKSDQFEAQSEAVDNS